jgi:hypothetical protein
MKGQRNNFDRSNPLGHDYFIVSGCEIFQLHGKDLVLGGDRLLDVISVKSIDECNTPIDFLYLLEKITKGIAESDYLCEYWNICDKENTLVKDYIISDEELLRLNEAGVLFDDVKDAKEYVENMIETGQITCENYEKCKEEDDGYEVLKKFADELKSFANKYGLEVTGSNIEPRRFSYNDGKITDHKTGDVYGLNPSLLDSLREGIKRASSPFTVSIEPIKEEKELGMKMLKDRKNDFTHGNFFVYVDEENKSTVLFEGDTRWAYVNDLVFIGTNHVLVDYIYNSTGKIYGNRLKMSINDMLHYFDPAKRVYKKFPLESKSINTPEHYNGIKIVNVLSMIYIALCRDSGLSFAEFCNGGYSVFTIYNDDLNNPVLSHVRVNQFTERDLMHGYFSYEEEVLRSVSKDIKKVHYSDIKEELNRKFGNVYTHLECAVEAYGKIKPTSYKKVVSNIDEDDVLLYFTSLEDLHNHCTNYSGFLLKDEETDKFKFVDVKINKSPNKPYVDFVDVFTGEILNHEYMLNKELVVLKEIFSDTNREDYYVSNNLECISKYHGLYKITGKNGFYILAKAFNSLNFDFYNKDEKEMWSVYYNNDDKSFCIDDIDEEFEYDDKKLYEILVDEDIIFTSFETIFEIFEGVTPESLF